MSSTGGEGPRGLWEGGGGASSCSVTWPGGGPGGGPGGACGVRRRRNGTAPGSRCSLSSLGLMGGTRMVTGGAEGGRPACPVGGSRGGMGGPGRGRLRRSTSSATKTFLGACVAASSWALRFLFPKGKYSLITSRMPLPYLVLATK